MRASILTRRPDGAQRHVDPFHQEASAAPKETSAKSNPASRRKAVCVTAETPVQALETSPQATETRELNLERLIKQDRMLILLSRPEGPSIEEMMRATDWRQHSVRGFLAATLKNKLALSQTSSKAAGDVRRYRIEKRRGC